MKKQQLFFDNGLREIEINGDSERVLKWNAKDINFYSRFFKFMKWFEYDLPKLVQEDLKTVEENIDSEEGYTIEDFALDALSEKGKIIEEKVDEAFGRGTSEVLFQGVNPLTSNTADSILISEFIIALEPIISESFKEAGIDTKTQQEKAKEYLERKQKISRKKV